MPPYFLGGDSRRSRIEEPMPPTERKTAVVREFWQRSFRGEFLPDYDAGVTLGQADLDADTTTGYDEIDHTAPQDRGRSWEARRDGYLDTIRPVRGTTKLG